MDASRGWVTATTVAWAEARANAWVTVTALGTAVAMAAVTAVAKALACCIVKQDDHARGLETVHFFRDVPSTCKDGTMALLQGRGQFQRDCTGII